MTDNNEGPERGSGEWVHEKILQQFCDQFYEKYKIYAVSSTEYQNSILFSLAGMREPEVVKMLEKIRADFPEAVLESLAEVEDVGAKAVGKALYKLRPKGSVQAKVVGRTVMTKVDR